MKLLPDASIDMILCDLPYGTTQNKWDVTIPFDKLWEQYERVIKSNGAIVLTGQGIFSARLICSNERMYRYSLIWEKTRSGGFLNAKRMPLTAHEDILVFYKKLPIYNPVMAQGNPYIKINGTRKKCENYGDFEKPYKQNNTGYRFPRSVIKIKNHNQDSLHPTQKPVALFEYLIKTYTNEGDIVLDNCAGSGTTGEACENTGRGYILMEKEEKYYKLIVERLRKPKTLELFNNLSTAI